MWRKYGYLGIILIVIGQINQFFSLPIISQYSFLFLWIGYILTVDAAVYKLQSKSLLYNQPKKFAFLFLLSAAFWLVFEAYNLVLKGWFYVGGYNPIMFILAFSTIIPAVFETTDLIKAVKPARNFRIKHHRIGKISVDLIMVIGVICLILPLLLPQPLMWVLVWLGFFLLLDPINYLHKERSILREFETGKLTYTLPLFIAGYITGFFWELWNFKAHTKWIYTVPILDQIKVFEIPVLGFLAYGFFAWELFVFYTFVSSLIKHKHKAYHQNL